ncbi:DUF294 nucleotidyltransferase-like domain-containing protein [Alkalihalobacterium alkalicellulosilyticum]|uniref:DUF294 nucleotidyltransferase-like domain-containing protein n=1 Tax=Alkalihalobacterium alkalicellulosilyticum TaxID=1912214 RepID=UPI000998033C|nr:DUF294 nucleotidyltransferase-like domain-containing protein [Bacillus alkalicellulosilyticus]
MDTYEKLKQWRQEQMKSNSTDHYKLNLFHDDLIQKVVQIALEKVKSEWGEPPAHFAFFMMGSAARFEQAIWSDQDHGIIYENTSEPDKKDYFLRVGEELSTGFAITGYERCDGMVMANNSKWCNSIHDWEQQLRNWLEQEKWETLRHVITFIDSRVIYGKKELLSQLKKIVFSEIQENPQLLIRFLENVEHRKKAIGIFGQLLPEQFGERAGSLQFKHAVLFPYVNSMRLLALKEGIEDASTITRMQQLPEKYNKIKEFETEFSELLSFRLKVQQDVRDYDSVHYIQLEKLTHNEKEQLKRFIRGGKRLYNETKRWIEKGCSTWS